MPPMDAMDGRNQAAHPDDAALPDADVLMAVHSALLDFVAPRDDGALALADEAVAAVPLAVRRVS
jgi:hypothetical protein